MINSADLRLGNIVLDIERGEIATVIGIEADRVQLKPSPYIWTKCENIEGVKISDEWLTAYGFDNINNKLLRDNCVLVINSWGYSCENIDTYSEAKYINYLHELQNSYKTVEGTELKMILT